jgi:putative ABC transport system substrate-binding protein
LLVAGSAILLAPKLVTAQSVKRIAVAVPYSETDRDAQRQFAAFRDELKRLGWVEGRNVAFDARWTADSAQIQIMAKDVAAMRPDLIFSRTTPVTAALIRETQTIPIVFVVVSDPVGDRLVQSLAHPGGNVTGFTTVESSLGGRWLQLLKEFDPRIARVAVIFGPDTAPGHGTYYLQVIENAGASLGVKVIPTPVRDAKEIDHAITALARRRNVGVIVPPDVTVANNRRQILDLVAKHRLIAVYGATFFADAGGLIAYGIEYLDLYRRAASYADRILRGEKSAELPIQGPTTFELVLNVKAARALGIKIPQSVFSRVDRLVE